MNQITQAADAAANATAITASGMTAPLTFIRRSESKPVFLSSAMTGGAPEVLFETVSADMPIHDMRPFADVLSVDDQGFQLVRDTSSVRDFYDDTAITDVYHAEIEALLKRELGAAEVMVFDVTRRADSDKGAANPDGLRGPASRIHVDYTETSGPARFADVAGAAAAERILGRGKRVAQVNVWRPIRGPVRRSPLALADAQSVRAEDLIATDQVFPDRTGEIYHVAHAADQRWYYVPEMTPDEALLIKGWDTDPARARFTPHTAFDPPGLPAGAPPRESIEVRTFAVFD